MDENHGLTLARLDKGKVNAIYSFLLHLWFCHCD